MNYKEEMKAMFEKMYKIGFEAGFTEGVKAKFDKSEDEDKTLWVGDEVKITGGTIGIITRISKESVGIVDANGSTYWVGRKYAENDLKVEKTGRKYPELEKLFQKIKENNT